MPTTSMLTAGLRLYIWPEASRPVLISAAIDWMAKYMDLKGFVLNHLYRTEITALLPDNCSIRNPAKKAAGNRVNRNSLKLSGLASRF